MILTSNSPEQQLRCVANRLLVLANDLDRPDRRQVLHIVAQELDLMAERMPGEDREPVGSREGPHARVDRRN